MMQVVEEPVLRVNDKDLAAVPRLFECVAPALGASPPPLSQFTDGQPVESSITLR